MKTATRGRRVTLCLDEVEGEKMKIPWIKEAKLDLSPPILGITGGDPLAHRKRNVGGGPDLTMGWFIAWSTLSPKVAAKLALTMLVG